MGGGGYKIGISTECRFKPYCSSRVTDRASYYYYRGSTASRLLAKLSIVGSVKKCDDDTTFYPAVSANFYAAR
eukprot:scaffold41196_cov155-Skeletonema_dohrnii-CCMP3373.AAC.2